MVLMAEMVYAVIAVDIANITWQIFKRGYFIFEILIFVIDMEYL